MNRGQINDYLNSVKTDFYFLHCDSWHYKAEFKIINIGVQEFNAVNLSYGLALAKHKVILYSIAGFVIEKCLEQLRLMRDCDVMLLTAGLDHEYPPSLGKGHQINPEGILTYLKEHGWSIYSDDFTQCFNCSNKRVFILGKEP